MRRDPIDDLAVNTIRILAADMVETAGSGHPGLPMGAAPMAYVLWTKVMKHNPANPQWLNRDRFVLSAGHGSALLYALLHLTGYDLPLDELRNFRQWGSRTPGHPEYRHTCGVETTTGPLGQGFANAVGMAIAEKYCAARMNRQDIAPIDYRVYILCSDGDLMEGISSEAASIAGHLRLQNLVCLYDDNSISIEGSTRLAFTENTTARFQAYGWNVLHVEDGNDLEAIEDALLEAKKENSGPTLIKVMTTIGYGSPHKQGKAEAHGAPLGPDELKLVKRHFGFPEDAFFSIPEAVRTHMGATVTKGKKLEASWSQLWDAYNNAHPDSAKEFADASLGTMPAGWQRQLSSFSTDKPLATRNASREILHALAGSLPFLIGGSADLAPSTGTAISDATDFSPDSYVGTNFRFGVREHAMGAILNGMALSGPIRPYGATFLVFADYMKPALRLSAIMQLPATFIFSHDSIAVGEDGPTHQPVEQLAMLRSIPGMTVIRPADANETRAAWSVALTRNGPVSLILSRQSLPVLDTSLYPVADGLPRGGYILADWGSPSGGGGKPVILIATGSEVHPALEAQEILEDHGVPTRVVSMPSVELFLQQSLEYRHEVLPPSIRRRVVIEAASPFGWHRFAGNEGSIIGVERFGASAPGNRVQEEFGFTATHIVEVARNLP
ncbi:transketolase [Prosthecochloris sp. CIB 2401]|uniref:transketolase n=1 Tax=Prosthecochloris sp. CIB 2401 TaxID=1868325 RepID=UPI00080AA2CB|nr:transketolase [Prosthecochloris sp. CIB 2401]ANT65715.1 Transketolase [Prosthecochloris sp. CIB 2401]